ncbi:MAG: zinc dependent phospholipase C family protein [Desulfocucumaceae bacterium]
MPDVWTHIFCGREVLARVEDDFRKAARENMNLFNYGCQGPDFFFYYNFLPWDEDKRGFLIGNQMHQENSHIFFLESLNYLRRNPDPGTTVYLMAFVCHWCLDRVTHPYINYISGIYRGYKNEPKKLINNHKRVEAAIDVLMGLRLQNINVPMVPVHREIDVGESLPGEILGYYRYILPLVYRESYESMKGTEFVNKSYRDMITALRVLYDPWGVKRLLVSVYDFASKYTRNMRYFFYRAAERNAEAYLNEENRPWCHPFDPGEIYTDSFIDLFYRGVEESVEAVNLSLRYIRGEVGEAELCEIIKDVSYATGKPGQDRRAMVSFSPVLEE